MLKILETRSSYLVITINHCRHDGHILIYPILFSGGYLGSGSGSSKSILKFDEMSENWIETEGSLQVARDLHQTSVVPVDKVMEFCQY